MRLLKKATGMPHHNHVMEENKMKQGKKHLPQATVLTRDYFCFWPGL